MLGYRVFFDQRIHTLTYSFEMMKQSHLSYEQSNGIGIFNLKNVVFMIAGFIFSLVTFQVGKNFKLVVYRKRELDICFLGFDKLRGILCSVLGIIFLHSRQKVFCCSSVSLKSHGICSFHPPLSCFLSK